MERTSKQWGMGESYGSCENSSQPFPIPSSLPLNRSNHSDRHKDDGAHQFQDTSHRDPNQPKRQQQQPHKRVSHQCQQRQRPAQHQQNAPQQEFRHDVSPYSIIYRYAPWAVAVPDPHFRFFEPTGPAPFSRSASTFFRSLITFPRSFSGIASTSFVRLGSFS